ncbi:MAG: aminoglycoside phosphotransferase family protein [Actinophytocola sp.]|uniref:aminoglycoside phosphotransferase family protein n=1 Tax=Actinophytocola sp. TaxID=1872138 RepID=UPI003C7963D6
MAEEPLVGGHDTEEVVRVGATVRRTRGSRSPFAARVLRHLESAGYPHAPRYLGVDEQGRDILSYIPGRTTDHPTQRAQGAYALAGTMLRRLHEATDGHAIAGDHQCVIHGDPGPFNTVFQDGLPVAFIDWTSCSPGSRLDDVGYMAWTWCIQALGNVPIADQAAHLRELRDGYGDIEPERLIAAMVRQQTRLIDAEQTNLHDPALTATRRDHARDAITWATSDRALIERHRSTLLSALR